MVHTVDVDSIVSGVTRNSGDSNLGPGALDFDHPTAMPLTVIRARDVNVGLMTIFEYQVRMFEYHYCNCNCLPIVICSCINSNIHRVSIKNKQNYFCYNHVKLPPNL